jgi:hypothetical protein
MFPREMSERINLADPDFEPTDEQLEGLMKRAFADVGARHREAMERMRARIASLREEAIRDLDALQRAEPPK